MESGNGVGEGTPHDTCVSHSCPPSIGQVGAQKKSINILERWIGVMGKGVRDVTKQAARETTEVAMKKNERHACPAVQ